MSHQVIHTQSAPKAVGPYSQGIRSGPLVFVSAQLPIEASGKMVSDDLSSETRTCLENIESILNAGGATSQDIVRVTVYLTDIADFQEVNAVYETFFAASSVYPTRVCIEVSALPKGVRIAMDAIAYTGG